MLTTAEKNRKIINLKKSKRSDKRFLRFIYFSRDYWNFSLKDFSNILESFDHRRNERRSEVCFICSIEKND
jgi:hypothetical protein